MEIVMEIIYTDKAPAAIGPYSQAIAIDNLIYTSGQIGINPETGVIVAGGIVEETEQVISNIKEILLAGKTDFNKVIKTTCFLADMSDFAVFNGIYAKYFVSKPARSCVAVAKLPKGAMVEIEVIAAIK